MNQPLELYEYVLWNSQDRGLFTYATGMVAAHTLQDAAEKAGEECRHALVKHGGAHISVRKWGMSAPVVWHE